MNSRRSTSFGYNSGFKNDGREFISAASKGDFETVSQVIASGSYTEDQYKEALQKASGFGHLDLAKALASLPDLTPYIAMAAARTASQYEHSDILHFFLRDKGIDANANHGVLAEVAAQFGRLNSLKTLGQFEFNFVDNASMAFKKASDYLHVDCLSFMIANGFTLSSTNVGKPYGFDSIDIVSRLASKADKEEGVFELFELMVENNSIDFELKNYAMVKAASFGNLRLFKFLLHNGAEIDFNKVEALSEAARFSQKNVVEYILRHTNYTKHIGLQRALKKANDFQRSKESHNIAVSEEITRLIIREVLNGNSGQTFITIAIRCLNGRQWYAVRDIISANPLLVNNADIVSRIVKFSSDDLLGFAIDQGLDIKEGLFDIALDAGNIENARTLLEVDAPIVDIDQCLINAAKFGALDIVKQLQSMGAKIDAYDSAAVNLACQYNHDDVTEYLKSNGLTPSPESVIIGKENKSPTILSNH